jgi:peptide/nickel transport system permease protein
MSALAGRVPILRLISWDLRLTCGVAIVAFLFVLGPLGSLVVARDGLLLGSGGFGDAPSPVHPFGTDTTGRDILAMIVYGALPTLKIGLIAGGIGTVIGVAFGLVSGYSRGRLDMVIRSAADVALTIPALAVLVVLTAFVRSQTIELMAVIVGLFAWPFTTRAIRAQTLVLRERGFVTMARLSARSSAEIMFLEILPNLLPYVIASFVGAVSGAILVSVGLQLLGLGPITTPTMGLILQHAFSYAAVSRGMWWWWVPPTCFLVLLFTGLFLISVGLDAYANPRLRRSSQ